MTIWNDIKMQYRLGGITNKIIYWNIALFLISILFFYDFKFSFFDYPEWLALSSNWTEFSVFPWTFVSYAFLHDGFLHLLFNMLVLNFTGRLFLTFFTEKQFIGVYFLGAIFSGIVFVLFNMAFGTTHSLVGASAAIMALLLAITTYQPLMQIRLMLIGYVKLWHIAAVFLLLDLMYVRFENTGGHISHLSGALFGFIFIKLLQQGYDISRWVTGTINFFSTLFDRKKRTPFKKVHVTPKKKSSESKSKIVMKDKTQQQIDEILDKISQSGYDSLSKEEKEFLFNSSNKK